MKCIELLEPRTLFAVIYVDINAHAAAPDGTSWQTAYADLQPALQAAAPGTQIEVADGTYKPTSANSRAATFLLPDNISILGGFAGFGAANPDARDTTNTPTILSGDIGVPGVTTDNSYHVVTINNTGSSATLDGVTITGGYADDSAPLVGSNLFGALGGGIVVNSSFATINNCIITGNTAFTQNIDPFGFGYVMNGLGGGMFVGGFTSPKVTNCIFSNNSASGAGGGLADAVAFSPQGTGYANCAFFNNTARSGGGMVADGSGANVFNCTFSKNTATSDGGGFYDENLTNNGDSPPTLTNCILYGNSAPFDADLENEFTGGNVASVTYSDVKDGFIGQSNFDADPLFVNAAANNFQLQSSSPCFNAGTNQIQFIGRSFFDLAGNPRIAFGIIDVGAYESTVPRINYVDVNAAGANNGASWTDAFTDLSTALASARSGVNIFVAQGSYLLGPPSTATFQLLDGVGIYGGYRGGAVSPSSRDVAAYPTILTDGSPHSHIVTASNVGSGTILDGLVIDEEQAFLPTGVRQGRDLFISNASPTINNCTFTRENQNGHADQGDGIYTDSTTAPQITNCTFANFFALDGGAIAIFHQSPIINGCTFTNNTAGEGGAIYSRTSSPLTVTNCTFTGNTALAGVTGGGAISAQGLAVGDTSGLTVVSCVFNGNAVPIFNGGDGGTIYNRTTTFTLASDTIYTNFNNSAFEAVYSTGGTSTIVNCIVWGAPNSFSGITIDQNVNITYSDIYGTAASSSAHDLDADPLFADPANGNLQLMYNSPCVDSGNNAVITASADLIGKPRIVNGTVDMGAYEFQGTVLATAGNYQFNAPRPAVVIGFSADLNPGTVSPGDLILNDLTTSQTINTSSLATVTYDSSTQTANWAFNTSLLPDGDYQAKLAAGSVADTTGRPLGGAFSFSFFVLAGDANQDRHVSTQDFMALATNFNKTGEDYSQGDFNYDGKVNALDFNMLATSFGKTVAAAPLAASSTAIANVQSAPSTPPGTLFSTKAISPPADSLLS